MPNKKSAIKALKQSKKRALKNAAVKSSLKKSLKMTRKMITSEGTNEAAALLKKTIKEIAMAGQKGILKKNTMSRKISRIQKAFNKQKSS